MADDLARIDAVVPENIAVRYPQLRMSSLKR